MFDRREDAISTTYPFQFPIYVYIYISLICSNPSIEVWVINLKLHICPQIQIIYKEKED